MHELLTKYECAHALGMRYLQLQRSAACTTANLRAHVVRELLDGDSTFVVRRTMPDGSFTDVCVRDLEISDDLREQLQYMLECAQLSDP